MSKSTEEEATMRAGRRGAMTALLAMAVIGAAAGNAVSAERTVLMEYFNATW